MLQSLSNNFVLCFYDKIHENMLCNILNLIVVKRNKTNYEFAAYFKHV